VRSPERSFPLAERARSHQSFQTFSRCCLHCV
jgi:hypothetical protein